ncbi:hypothetical protein UB43_05530 [Pseudomonas sp. 21]|uniref:hypothetical protein n=1 Tax=unclassified Pseudomonas TaxID=196821 RepID=UPI0005EBE87A|nr:MULTISPECIES: hypothetical protein [unclassified Pseudomonas]KJK02740.1 hypothetical protein UB43_05530 [Pseudomonas sp. 21]MBV7585449.1 hypothetical protein [Pseudomonas sp. PDM33]
MAVRLDKVPPPAKLPAPPGAWVWLGLLLLALLIGMGSTLLLGEQSLGQQPLLFWGRALGIPLVVWSLLLFGRFLLHISLLSSAEGWDEAREADWLAKLRKGRRSQQVLAVSLYTALRDEGDAQFEALTCGKSELKTQTVRGKGELTARHTAMLPVMNDVGKTLDDAAMLLRLYRQVLGEMAVALRAFPAEQPLMLVQETDSSVPPALQQDAWQRAWAESGIRQSVTRLEREGLDAVDHWLDKRIADPALVLVVALCVAPEPREDSAEVAVALLLGNRLTQKTAPIVAYLHRPEQEHGTTGETLRYAVHQALDWVPLKAEALQRAWLVGIPTKRQGDVNKLVLELLKPDPVVRDLGACLGYPGCAAPWVAIAAAVEAVRREGQPQIIFSSNAVADSTLWSSVVAPSSP